MTEGCAAALGAQGGKSAPWGAQRRLPVELSFDELLGTVSWWWRGWNRRKEEGIACKKACKM